MFSTATTPEVLHEVLYSWVVPTTSISDRSIAINQWESLKVVEISFSTQQPRTRELTCFWHFKYRVVKSLCGPYRCPLCVKWPFASSQLLRPCVIFVHAHPQRPVNRIRFQLFFVNRLSEYFPGTYRIGNLGINIVPMPPKSSNLRV